MRNFLLLIMLSSTLAPECTLAGGGRSLSKAQKEPENKAQCDQCKEGDYDCRVAHCYDMKPAPAPLGDGTQTNKDPPSQLKLHREDK